jgi:hypothetical protein
VSFLPYLPRGHGYNATRASYLDRDIVVAAVAAVVVVEDSSPGGGVDGDGGAWGAGRQEWGLESTSLVDSVGG